MNTKKPIAIIGSGPAGLMAAHVLSSKGYKVHVYEKKSGLGRKILIACKISHKRNHSISLSRNHLISRVGTGQFHSSGTT